MSGARRTRLFVCTGLRPLEFFDLAREGACLCTRGGRAPRDLALPRLWRLGMTSMPLLGEDRAVCAVVGGGEI
jgi:hypothetical protein